MKIDAALVSMDKDVPSKGAGGTDADRGTMGEAFGKAVQDAGGKRPAAHQDKPGKTDAAASGDREAPAPDADATSDAAVEAGTALAGSDPASLQTLLGALVGLSVQKDGGKGSASDTSGESDGKEGQDAEALALSKLKLSADGAAADDTKTRAKRGMQLDVVRMETHFEPRQDGMLLVEGSADGAKAIDAKGTPTAADSVAAALADLTKAKSKEAGVASRPTGAGQAANDDNALPPMRFDEALARFGRGSGSDRSGEGNNRDGSASARAALAELTAARNTAKGADGAGITAGVDDMLASASPYNLAGQVAGPIMEALGDPGQAPFQASQASTDAHLRMRAGGGALKTLTIQLHPEHLGTVDVSMRLNEGRLTLELAASRSDTASMLLDDQVSLRKLLEHAGFSLDDAAISVITRDSGQVRTAESGGTNAQPRDPSGNGAGDTRQDARGQSGTPDDQSGRRRAPQRPAADTASSSVKSSATYL